MENIQTHSKCTRKYYDHKSGTWKPLFMVEGMSAYQTAVLHGYQGDESDFYEALASILDIYKEYKDIKERLDDLIIDNLESTETNKALSANQGRLIKELIEKLDSINWKKYE